MRPHGGKRGGWCWLCAVLSLASCADHTEEDARACANWACTAGSCQAGPTGPVCVCGAFEQALGLTCELLPGDSGNNDDFAHAEPIALGTDVHSSIAVPTNGAQQDVDLYRLDATPGRVYLVEAASGPSVSIDLIDADDTVRASAGGTNIQLAGPISGTRAYVRIRATDPRYIGEYVLRVTDYAAADVNAPLEPGGPMQTRTIAPAGEVDRILLDVVPGAVYAIDCSSDAPLSLSINIEDGLMGYGRAGFPALFKTEAGRTYHANISGMEIGIYRCTLVRNPDDDAGDTHDTALPLTAPASFAGRVDFPGDHDVFAIPGHRAKYLWAHVPGCTPYFGLLTDDGSPSYTNYGDGWAFMGPLSDETVFLDVACSSSARLTYQLELEELTDAEGDDEGTTAVASVGTVSGRFDFPGDQDVFRFAAQAHRLYSLPFDPAPESGWFAEGTGVNGVPAMVGDEVKVVFSRDDDGPVFLRRAWSYAWSLSPVPYAYADPLVDLGIVDPEPGTPGAAIPAALDTVLSGAAQYPGDTDCYAFQIPPGVAETVDTAAQYYVFSPDGTQSPLTWAPTTIPAGSGGRYVVCTFLWTGGVVPRADVPYSLRVHP